VQDKNKPHRDRPESRQEEQAGRRHQEPGRTWADDAAEARSSDDPRARTPRDAAGQPSTRSFEE
jgi:hypothetical protein